MNPTNGETPIARIDISLRIVADVPSYLKAGGMMDAVHRSLTEVLDSYGVKARFDFTGIQTHPCKAAQMEQLAYSRRDFIEQQFLPDASPSSDDF